MDFFKLWFWGNVHMVFDLTPSPYVFFGQPRSFLGCPRGLWKSPKCKPFTTEGKEHEENFRKCHDVAPPVYSRERLQCAPAYCAHYNLDMFTVRTSLLWEGNFSRWKWIFYENFTNAFNFYFKKGTDTVRGTLTVRTFLASTVSVPDCTTRF